MYLAINKEHHVVVSFFSEGGDVIAKASVPWASEWFVENHEFDIAKQRDTVIAAALLNLIMEGYFDLGMSIQHKLKNGAMCVEITVLSKYHGETPESEYSGILITTSVA